MELDPKANNGEMYFSKFFRVEEQIVTTPPQDLLTEHTDLARQEGLFEKAMQLITSNPSDVDAGQIVVVPSGDGKSIEFYLESITMRIPTIPKARQKTGEIARTLFPDYEIIIS
jgi:hypothetical protein